jgi:hypothetical protein
MNNLRVTSEVTFSCYACAYARPVPSPFEDWVWCEHPADQQLLNLARDAECRRRGGGATIAVSRGANEASVSERDGAIAPD